MPKKPRVRTLMDSQHVKGSETLLKSARQYFCLIFWSVWKKIRSKKSVLVIYETSDCLLTYWHPMTSILSQ